MLPLLLLFSLVGSQPSHLLKRQELPVYSFDYSAHRSPLAYSTHQAAIELVHRTKLIPAVKANNGAVVLKRVSLITLTCT
jgi:hypothetical protein